MFRAMKCQNSAEVDQVNFVQEIRLLLMTCNALVVAFVVIGIEA